MTDARLSAAEERRTSAACARIVEHLGSRDDGTAGKVELRRELHLRNVDFRRAIRRLRASSTIVETPGGGRHVRARVTLASGTGFPSTINPFPGTIGASAWVGTGAPEAGRAVSQGKAQQ